MSRMVSFIALIAIIVVIGFLFFRVMAPFLLPLFLAVLMVVIFHPIHRRILNRCRGRVRVASAVTTCTVLLIVLLPLLVVMVMAAAEGSAVLARQDPAELRAKIARARDQFDLLKMPYAEPMREIERLFSTLIATSDSPESPPHRHQQLSALSQQLSVLQGEYKVTTEAAATMFDAIRDTLQAAVAAADKPDPPLDYRDALRGAAAQFHSLKLELLGGEVRTWLKELANPTEEELQQNLRRALDDTKGTLFALGGRSAALLGRLAIGLVIMAVAMFFFLADGPAMVSTVMRLSPLDDRYEQELLADFTNVSRAVVLATLLSAAAQGLLSGVGFYLAGFHGVVLLMLLTGLLAMIPFVGAAAVWVPGCLWLYFIEERWGAALLLAVYGVAVISSIDNLIKPFVLHGRSRLHPLLALLSVLGGVNALGPIGILVGPMSVAFLQTLLNILHRELSQFDSDRHHRVGEPAAGG